MKTAPKRRTCALRFGVDLVTLDSKQMEWAIRARKT